MKLDDLVKQMQDMGIRDDAYSFSRVGANETYVLEKKVFYWEAYYAERGEKNNLHRFISESEACEYFLAMITQDSTTRR